MRIPTPGFLLTAFFQVCRRFPSTILIALLGTAACLGLLETHGIDNENFFIRNWITCQLGLPLLTALVAYSESKHWREVQRWLLQIGGFVVLVGCWFWLDNKAADFEWRIIPQYIALLLTMHLIVAFAPYLNNRSIRDFWEYNRQLFANFIVGAAFTLILYAGLALAMLAVVKLFDLDLSEKLFGKLFVLLTGLFNPAYFLYHFPQKFGSEAASSPEEPDPGAYSWVFRNLCKFILIPIVLLYFVILYAYGAKVGLQWALPKGWISSLVIGFSVAGIFTYLLNYYLEKEDDSLLVKGFKRWFWWALLPLTVLLFIAIGKRISDYGVTEERFLVAQLGIWLAATCLYFLFSKNDNIKFIPISLALFALVWAFGPLSAFSVSERSQKGILTEILTQNGRFENGKMKPGTAPLTDPEAAQVSSALNFLEKHNALNSLLPTPIDSAWLEYNGVLTWLKIESTSSQNTNTYTVSLNRLDDEEALDVRGFDLLYPVKTDNSNDRSPNEMGNFFYFSDDRRRLEWFQTKAGESTLVETYNLIPMIQKWSEKKEADKNYVSFTLPVQERTFNFSTRKGSLKLVIQEAEIEVDGQEKKLSYCNGWVLLKTK